MNKLSTKERAAIIRALVEGNSVRATCRIVGVAKGTVLKFVADIGAACFAFHNRTIQHVKAKRVQCDEAWGFCYAKAKNVPEEKLGQLGYGDTWTWMALDADSKLLISWHVGMRDAGHATQFMRDLAWRLAGRVQLTTDGLRAYVNAVNASFGRGQVDFAQLVKVYRHPRDDAARYSPPECVGCQRTAVTGNPNPKHVSTSFIERSNLTLRMGSRRFTRLTNAFSKKLDNMKHALALHFVHYNFVRVHQTLKTTPAVQAGMADRIWTVEDMVGLLGD